MKLPIPITTLILIILALGGLIFSLVRSRQKTGEALRFARGMFLGTLSEVLAVMGLIGLILALLPPEVIGRILGGTHSFLSSLTGAVLGAVTIIPGFIAFPLADTLRDQGAHTATIAAFITTLTMVGIATYPLEVRHFGRTFTLVRNGLSFGAALLIAIIMGVFL